MTKTRIGRPIAALLIALAATMLAAEESVAGGQVKTHPGGTTQKFECVDPNLRQPREYELHVSPPCGPVGTKALVSQDRIAGGSLGLRAGDRVSLYITDEKTFKSTDLGTAILESSDDDTLKFSREVVIAPSDLPSSFPRNFNIAVDTPGGWTIGGVLFSVTG